MAKRRGRPPGSGNRKHQNQDREDCIAIARLRLAEPGLKIWTAICRVTGVKGKWRHQRARERRLRRIYGRNESHYLYLAQVAAQSDRLAAQPARPCTADDLATAFDFGAALRAFAEQEADRARIMRDSMANPTLPDWAKLDVGLRLTDQTSLQRLAQTIVPDWPKLDVGLRVTDQLKRHFWSRS
jgi:hypothetical protein